MVQVRVSREVVQVLGATPPMAGVKRQEAEAALADATTGAAAVRASRVLVQVLVKTPPTAKALRQEAEAALADATTGTAAVRASRALVQVLAKAPPLSKVIRQEAEAALADATSGAAYVRVARAAIQVLMKTPPPGPTPIDLPTFFGLFKHNWQASVAMASPFRFVEHLGFPVHVRHNSSSGVQTIFLSRAASSFRAAFFTSRGPWVGLPCFYISPLGEV